MNIKMIVSDIDGTLLPYGGLLPDIIPETWNALHAKGFEMLTASGRVLGAFPESIMALSGRYVISSNGAVITDRVAKKRIYEMLMPAEQTADILELLRQYENYTCVYMDDWAYNWDIMPSYVDKYYPGRKLFRYEPKEDLAAYIRGCTSGTEKIFVVVDSLETKARVRDALVGIPGIQCTSSSSMNLEINHANADKGTAVAWLGEYLGISKDEIMALGDNENDHTMLSYAGYAVVPISGKEETRKLADRIVGACRDGGIAEFLRETFL